MNPLASKIAQAIATHGPLSIAQFMRMALLDQEQGYYQQAQVFGRQGDFVTAPEISQMFGEMLGVWCAERWRSLGCPKNFVLLELGPGKGTMMHDILRACKNVPGMHQALQVYLYEASARLKAIQAETLADSALPINWLDDIAMLPHLPLIVVANEFFDAMPIHQLIWREQWFERYVGAKWHFVEQPIELVTWLNENAVPAAEYYLSMQPTIAGSILEIAPASLCIIRQLAMLITQQSGALLAIDYGYTRNAQVPVGDSLQAVRAHQYSELFADIGHSDITAHVDFSALQAAVGIAPGPVMTQQEFLERQGILLRAAVLGKQQDVSLELKRLLDPGQMGTLFKALAFQAA